jgi:hypothetical protein
VMAKGKGKDTYEPVVSAVPVPDEPPTVWGAYRALLPSNYRYRIVYKNRGSFVSSVFHPYLRVVNILFNEWSCNQVFLRLHDISQKKIILFF